MVARAAARVGDDRLTRYLGPHADVRVTEEGVEVSVPDRFTADLLGRTLAGEIRDAAAEVLDERTPRVRFTVREGTPGRTVGVAAPGKGAGEHAGEPADNRADTVRARKAASSRAAARRVRALKTLDDFLIGESNRVAYVAAERMADGADVPRVMIIHGACGVGKSHLVEGLVTRASRAGARVKLTTGEAFTSGFVGAVRRTGGEFDSVRAFQRAHRSVDLLCVDDAHVVAGRDKTQHELVQTIEALGPSGGRIVLVTDRHPSAVDKLQAALSSRLSAGLVVRVDPPERALVGRLLEREAQRRGLALTPEVRDMLCDDIERRASGAREIQGTIAQIDAVRRLDAGAGGVVDRAVLESAWRHRRSGGAATGAPIMPETVRGEVCRRLGVSEGEFVGTGRVKRTVIARMLVVALCRRMTGASFPEIARAMGRNNHTTAITQMRRVEKGIEKGERVDAGCELDGLTLCDAIERLDRAVRVAHAG